MINWCRDLCTTSLNFRYKHNNIFSKRIAKMTYKLCLRVVQIFVPMLYSCIENEDTGVTTNDYGVPIILSLTSFPARIESVWLTVETLMRQDMKPNRIILWLAKEQFTNGDADLPMKLLKLKKRGLEIRYCTDLISHKKYYYTMLENPKAVVITADDDIFYPSDMISLLFKKYKQYQDCVVCNRAHKITFSSSGQVSSYNKWELLSSGEAKPSMLLVPTGAGGCLYPPGCLDKEVFNIPAIKELAPLADDLWLKCMSLLKGRKVVKSKAILAEVFPQRGSKKTGLAMINVRKNQNDIQFAKIINRYNID